MDAWREEENNQDEEWRTLNMTHIDFLYCSVSD